MLKDSDDDVKLLEEKKEKVIEYIEEGYLQKKKSNAKIFQ